MEPEYRYESLEDQPYGTIRLLKLLPGKATEQIICHLEQATVIDEFTAISYVWGTDPATDMISVDGRPFYVRQNLFQCLLRIRDEVSESVLWIDAICVDQAKLRERSSQVMLMDRIFGNATTVVAWSGTDDGTDDTLVQLLQAWPETIFPRPRSYLQLLINALLATDKPSLFRGLREEAGYNVFEYPMQITGNVVRAILDRPYWTRMWIVQEMVVAKRLVFQYDRQQIDWQALASWTNRLLYWREFETVIHRSGILDIERHRRWREDGLTCPLRLQLAWYGNRACVDRRDKIISLLGITIISLDMKDRLHNDNLYEMSEVRLCEHAARRYDCSYNALASRIGILKEN